MLDLEPEGKDSFVFNHIFRDCYEPPRVIIWDHVSSVSKEINRQVGKQAGIRDMTLTH